MPSYTQYKRQMAVLDADDSNIESWITVKGNHIPIMKGQSKEDAVKSFIEKKGGKYKEESYGKHYVKTGEKGNEKYVDPRTDTLHREKSKVGFFGSEKEAKEYAHKLNHTDPYAGTPFAVKNYKRTKFPYNVESEEYTESKKESGEKKDSLFPQSFSEPKKASPLRSSFGKHYDKLYNDRDLDDKSGYLLEEWDKHIKDPKFKKAVQEFVEERGDFISSDREVKAFMLAAKENGLIADNKKQAKSTKSDSPLVKAVATALNMSEADAESEIDGAARYIKDLMKAKDLRNGDVEETLRGLGVEPDYAEEFMHWATYMKNKK